MALYTYLVLLIATIKGIDALECYVCSNATYVSECKSTTTCNAGEICFSEYKQTGNTKRYLFGCRSETKCSSIVQAGNNAGSGSIVGRSTSPGPCSECCREQHCNRQLCQHSFTEKECSDGTDIDCKSVGTVLDVCSDTQRAKTVCERFCGLCDYADGFWSSWLTWSSCDVTCGNGTQTRIRKCTEPPPSGGGHDCSGISQQVQTCTMEPCPVHGAWSSWDLWGSCSATCGIGLQRRDRACSAPYPGRHGNHCFGDSRDDQICLVNACSDGGWSSWLTWGTCSRTCGDGIRSRSRSCDNPLPTIQGKYCRGDPFQVETCNMKSCPVTNGHWNSWLTWTSCTASCNGGLQSRQRHCNNPKPSIGGDFCDGPPSDVRLCNQQQCPKTNGGWSSWLTWTSCTASCNGGAQSRQRHCNNPKPSADGDFCEGTASNMRLCNQQQCPRKKAAFLATAASKLSNGTVRFSTVHLNEGSVYNSSTGVFTCPFPGLYAFTANMIESSAGNNRIYCYLRKVDSYYVYIYYVQGNIDGKNAVNGYGTATGTATFHLVKGDRVYLYCNNNSGTSISDSALSGFLVSADP